MGQNHRTVSQVSRHLSDVSCALSWSVALRGGRWLGLLAVALSIPILACGTFTARGSTESVDAEAAAPRVIPTSTPITIPTPVPERVDAQTERGLGGTSAAQNNLGLAVAISNIPLVIGERAQVIANAGINVREFSSTVANEVGKLSPGDIVEVLEGPFTSEDLFWWRIRTLDELYEGMVAEGREGTEYLAPVANMRVPANRNPRRGDIVRVTAALNIRRDPGVSSPQLATLEADTELLVIDGPVHQGGYDWYQLQNEAGTLVGWSVAVIGERRTLLPLE